MLEFDFPPLQPLVFTVTALSNYLRELLETDETLDLLLDLGGEFKYRLKQPTIQGGKVFSPGTASFILFLPSEPWVQVPEKDFNSLMSRVRILTGGRGRKWGLWRGWISRGAERLFFTGRPRRAVRGAARVYGPPAGAGREGRATRGWDDPAGGN